MFLFTQAQAHKKLFFRSSRYTRVVVGFVVDHDDAGMYLVILKFVSNYK